MTAAEWLASDEVTAELTRIKAESEGERIWVVVQHDYHFPQEYVLPWLHSRAEAEEKAFKLSLESVNFFYRHREATVNEEAQIRSLIEASERWQESQR